MSDTPRPAMPVARPAVVVWLWSCASLLLAMIVLGGVVRLTRSGLSIAVWEPIVGTVPPLSDAAWERAFAQYRDTPEFRSLNQPMDLAGFQRIFWPEYFHRLLGRSIGLILLGPGAFFLHKGWVGGRLLRQLVLLLFLGGLQGLVGWLMVASGLVDAPHVSHCRLTLHLGLGFVLFGFATWIALEHTLGGCLLARSNGLGRALGAYAALVAVAALSGGLVAGLHGGHAFSTFPLMAGAWVPAGLLAMTPVWRNGFDNVITVMFQHRVLGGWVLGLAVGLAWAARRPALPLRVRHAIDAIACVAAVQVGLGVATVLLHVPVTLGAAHQGNAALLIAATLHALYRLRHSPPKTTRSLDRLGQRSTDRVRERHDEPGRED